MLQAMPNTILDRPIDSDFSVTDGFSSCREQHCKAFHIVSHPVNLQEPGESDESYKEEFKTLEIRVRPSDIRHIVQSVIE